MDYLLIIAGLALLFVGGEGLVRGAVSIAQRLGLSTVLIGAVIVGFGTSTPELVVSVKAALDGQTEIALGNIVGSNIANVMLIMALAALITPLACKAAVIRRDAVVVLAASLLLWALVPLGILGAGAGAVMLAALLGYVVYNIRAERQEQKRQKKPTVHTQEVEELGSSGHLSPGRAVIYCVISLAALMVGADWLVTGATTLARGWGISEAVIGLTLVAVGTSLPELATSIVAAYRRHTDVVVGNILGSNFYNILGILGVTGLLSPIPMTGQIATQDIPVMVAVAVLTALVVFGLGRISRTTGVVALVLYGAYMVWLFGQGSIA